MNNCQFCSRSFSRLEGKTLHEKHCKVNPYRIPGRKTSGAFKPGNSGKANDENSETARKEKIRSHAKAVGLGGYNPGSGRGKKGWYKGFFCDSSWELAFVIYCLDHNMQIQRNTKKRHYTWEDKVRNYIPDFIVDGKVVEVKGYKTAQWEAKLAANPDITVLYEQEMKRYLQYVIETYGKDYVLLYE